MSKSKISLAYVTGCLLGGAVGDALGAPLEFLSLHQILSKYGANGIADYAPAYGRKGAITDDTQMTLFTAEGLILSHVRGNPSEISQIPVFVYQAYLRWLSTQQMTNPDLLMNRYGSCVMVDGLLITRKEMYARRAPGNSCLSALMSGTMGTVSAPINDSKGCGGIMRIAPVGYFLKPESVFDTACEIAAITHGHPTGYLAAGCLAQIICNISYGQDILRAVDNTMKILAAKPNHQECLEAVENALKAVKKEAVSFATVEKLGAGWIAEEALAIGLYCAIAAGDDFEKGMRLAVNHSGDSDSTGSIAGNILGAMYGKEIIPHKYLHDLELIDTIQEIASDLFARVPDTGQ
ncbi:MAG: ADP-ribosylglycohydrolase family protein [Desulfococcaceae bacterium]